MTQIDRPLRVLHLTAGSDAGGLSRYIHDLCAAMHAQGHHVAIAGQHGAWHTIFENASASWIEVPLKGGPIALWRARRTLEAWLTKHPADVIHTHYRKPTLLARHLAPTVRAPILYTLHLSDISLAWGRRWMSDFGDHTHAASENARQWLITSAHVPAERITVIPHGIDVTKFPPADETTRRNARHALGLPASARVAAYVGRLDYPKNEQWLIDLAVLMPALHLLVAGDGPNEQALWQRVRNERLEPRVHLLGLRSPLAIYQAADALLLPSLREGFSLVCAEAMSVGVPVLRTCTAGTHELIVENITGRSTPIDHDAFLAAAVEFLSLDNAALRQMGTAAAEHVRRNFTLQQQVEQTLALYRQVAKLPI